MCLQDNISQVKGKMGASGREFDDRNRNMKEVIYRYKCTSLITASRVLSKFSTVTHGP